MGKSNIDSYSVKGQADTFIISCDDLMCVEILLDQSSIYMQVDDSYMCDDKRVIVDIGEEGDIDRLVGMLLLAKAKQLEVRRSVINESFHKGVKKKGVNKESGCFYTKKDFSRLCKGNSDNETNKG